MNSPRKSSPVALGILFAALACGPQKTAFDLAMDSVETAREKRDFEGADRALEKAAREAEAPRDRDEALYRRAHLAGERGNVEEEIAQLRALVVLSPKGERTPRALLDLGRALERLGRSGEALAEYEKLLSTFPNSGVALAAAERSVQLSGKEESQAYEDLLAKHPADELSEGLLFRLAKSQEPLDREAALKTYRRVVAAYPLPDGIFTDEAFLRIAELELAAGRVERALEALDPLIDAQSSASIVGSYNRTPYIEARLLRGILLRDQKRDFEQAEASFRSLIEDFPESRLVDDAYFELALTLRREKKNQLACEAMKELNNEKKEAPFSKCVALFCDDVETDSSSCCRRLAEPLKAELCEISTPR